jgi:hypothetical protein
VFDVVDNLGSLVWKDHLPYLSRFTWFANLFVGFEIMNEKLEKSILSKNQKGYELVTFCLN